MNRRFSQPVLLALLIPVLSLPGCGAKDVAPNDHAGTAPGPRGVSDEVRQLVEETSSADPVIRAKAALRSTDVETDPAVIIPHLVRLLDDGAAVRPASVGLREANDRDPPMQSEMTVGRLAAGALIRIGKPAVRSLLDVFEDAGESRDRRTAAQLCLEMIGGDEVLDSFVTVLRNPKENVWIRDHTVGMLAESGLPNAVQAFIAVLANKQEPPFFRATCAGALVHAPTDAATTVLMQVLSDGADDGTVRHSVAQTTGELCPTNALDLMKQVLRDEKEALDVRRSLAVGLGKSGNPRAVPLLLEASTSHERRLRAEAYFALSHFRDASLVDTLIAGLKDPESPVRQWVVYALVNTGDPRAVEAAIGTLDDTSETHGVRCGAAQWLARSAAPAAIDRAFAALRDDNEDVREVALSELTTPEARKRDPAAAEHWLAVLTDPAVSSSVRGDAARMLVLLSDEDPQIVGKFAHLLDNESAPVRMWAARALGEAGNARHIDALTALKKDPDAEVRSAASMAIELINACSMSSPPKQ